MRELWASVEARARGIRTPAVVAGAVYRAGVFYRADLVTDFVPGGIDLATALFEQGSGFDVAEMLVASGQLIRDLERAGVLHADLNAKNILLVEHDGRFEAHVLDLDRCRILSVDEPSPGHAMRRRLERSLRKLGSVYTRPLQASEWDALRTGMGGDSG